MSESPILITAALPYANGPLHLGHMLEYMQADIWARAYRAMGRAVYFVCADDCHGTAVMLKAQSQGQTPEEWIVDIGASRRADFAACGIHFDVYDTTHAETVRMLAERMFHALSAVDLIVSRPVQQLYDVTAGLFLADRYVKGTCPHCGAQDQYGDHCEQCGATYSATALLAPRSVLYDSLPETRESQHFFVRLSDPRCVSFLRRWTAEALPEEHYRKLCEWLGEPGTESQLTDWDISREAPYFGFAIPGASHQYFYVWWDAPITYMAMTHLLPVGSPTADDFWAQDSQAEIYHCIGKDIVYFHALFWPTVLHFSGYRLPTTLCIHGFVTINGEKMSKSRGTFITVAQYLASGYTPEYLRYYFASRLSDTAADIDFSVPDFVQKINADLVGKYGNILSRLSGLLMRHYDGVLSAHDHMSCTLCAPLIAQGPAIWSAYAARRFHQAVRIIMQQADVINQFIDQAKPWVLAKSPDHRDALHEVLTRGLYAFFWLSVYLTPILPMTIDCLETTVLKMPGFLSMCADGHMPAVPRLYAHPHLFQKVDQTVLEAALFSS